MGELVDEDDLRPAREHRVEVELGKGDAEILDLCPGDHLESLEQEVRLAAAVGFHVPYHHVPAVVQALVRGLQHGVGLADPGGVTEEDLQLPLRGLGLLGLRHLEQRFR